jgi:hypothetical protein
MGWIRDSLERADLDVPDALVTTVALFSTP